MQFLHYINQIQEIYIAGPPNKRVWILGCPKKQSLEVNQRVLSHYYTQGERVKQNNFSEHLKALTLHEYVTMFRAA